MAMDPQRRQLLFMRKVQVLDDGCWEWTGATDRYGYGKAKLGGQTLGAHRVAYMLFVGELAPGRPIDHICHEASCKLATECQHRRCVNPEHLRPTTVQENTERGNGGHLRAGQPWAGRPQIAEGAHCRAGLHPWIPANIIYFSNGRRGCRPCDRARVKRWRDKQCAGKA